MKCALNGYVPFLCYFFFVRDQITCSTPSFMTPFACNNDALMSVGKKGKTANQHEAKSGTEWDRRPESVPGLLKPQHDWEVPED